MQRDAAVEVDVGVRRRQRDGPVVGRERVQRAARGHQRHGAAVVEGRDLGPPGRGPVEQRDGLGEPAVLLRDAAQQVRRVALARVQRQHLAVKSLGLGERAGLVLADRPLQPPPKRGVPT